MNTPAIPALPCYLNGEFSTLDQARVSVLDRGFIFGDGIYEVVPVYAGRPFRFEQHMARLSRSLTEVRIPNPHTVSEWRARVDTLIERCAAAMGEAAQVVDQLVYIQVTRGVAMRDHTMVPGLEPTVFMMSTRMKPVSEEERRTGLSCITGDDFRWEKAHIKTVSLLGAVFTRQMSADVGAAETIMFRDGYLSEAAACNVWVVRNGEVLGSPKDNLVLEGIRYGLMDELCARAGLPLVLRRITRDEVLDADEILLSSATKEVVPVTRLDGQAVGTGAPGPVYQRLYALYQEAKAVQ